MEVFGKSKQWNAILDWTDDPEILDLNEKYTSVLFKLMLLEAFSIRILTNIPQQCANPSLLRVLELSMIFFCYSSRHTTLLITPLFKHIFSFGLPGHHVTWIFIQTLFCCYFFLKTEFSATACNTVMWEALQKRWGLGSSSRDSDLVGLGWGLASLFHTSSPVTLACSHELDPLP